jgi:KTSC domain
MDSLMQKVKSSNIESIGHDEKKKILYVKFLNGTMYSYTPFDDVMFTRFLKSKSKGTHFHKHIRTNRKFTVQKLL